jgi:hypothetical protein
MISFDQILFSPFVGYQFPLNDQWNGIAEFKWLASNVDTRHGIFEGLAAIGGKGNAGIYFGAQYTFPKGENVE